VFGESEKYRHLTFFFFLSYFSQHLGRLLHVRTVLLTELEMARPHQQKKKNKKERKKEKGKEGAVGRPRRRRRGAFDGPDLESLVPDEVLLLIFSFLGVDVSALCQAACTCRRFSHSLSCLCLWLAGSSMLTRMFGLHGTCV
jgi:hypothetical protein